MAQLKVSQTEGLARHIQPNLVLFFAKTFQPPQFLLTTTPGGDLWKLLPFFRGLSRCPEMSTKSIIGSKK